MCAVMSSHDAMGIVFKCLSKGAVDFLVKPIRKNELKNLWQHVWRRCHSVSCYFCFTVMVVCCGFMLPFTSGLYKFVLRYFSGHGCLELTTLVPSLTVLMHQFSSIKLSICI